MFTSTPASRRLRTAGSWLLAAALILPATAGSIRSACCIMESPCCPQMAASDPGQPTLSGPTPACCERVLATDRDAPAERRGSSAPPQWVAVIAVPAFAVPTPVVQAGIAAAPERCTDPPLSSRTGRSPPPSIV